MTTGDSTECAKVAPMLGLLLDGELGNEKVVEVEEHVAGCERCTERMTLRKAIATSLKIVSRKIPFRPSRGAYQYRRRSQVDFGSSSSANRRPHSSTPTL